MWSRPTGKGDNSNNNHKIKEMKYYTINEPVSVYLDNQKIRAAHSEKNNEYFLTPDAVERELDSEDYVDVFRGKNVYVPCHKYSDIACRNALRTYFLTNFERLGLNSLITSEYTYDDCIVTEVNKGKFGITKNSFKMEFDNDEERLGSVEYILNFVDIVVANPRGTIFCKFFDHVMNSGCDYILWGNQLKITNRNAASAFFNGKLRHGKTSNKAIPHFNGSEDFIKRMNATCVYTNLNVCQEKIVTPTKTTAELLAKGLIKKYDNINIVNVNRVEDIPCDYFEPIGVPISAIGCMDWSKFKVLGIFNGWDTCDFENGLISGEIRSTVSPSGARVLTSGPVLNGIAIFARLILQRIA